MEKQLETIKSLIENLLEKMSISGDIELIEHGEYPQFTIKIKEAGILIGENGSHLMAFNHILKKLADNEFKKNNTDRISFFLDINGYRAKKDEELRNLAQMSAQRAVYFKRDIEMEPMSAYERRIVHSALTEYPDIATESAGQDPYRKVVIKPLKQ